MKATIWYKYKCGGGAQWTSTTATEFLDVCNFSGCNCGTKVKIVGLTTSRDAASKWFKRPTPAK